MAKKSLKTNNLLIVCEGTETEYPYFEYLSNKVKHLFDNIKVVPSASDRLKTEELRKEGNRKKRRLSDEKKCPIYVTRSENEDNIYDNYEKYKKAPAKYVREAYLWLKDKTYTEAWAVYDLDDKDDMGHVVHKCAKELLDRMSSLHKAFSAYCFEEWLLLNFERCNTGFRNSAYKKVIKEEQNYECNGRFCQHKKECKSDCIGDYLSNKGYVQIILKKFADNANGSSNYSKNDGKVYAKAIYEDNILRHRAYVNAAWSRSLKEADFYDCNPYTDVDQLVMRLLGDNIDVRWIKINEKFTLNRHTFIIERKDNILFLSHQSTENCLLNRSQLYWCDDNYNKIEEAINGININFLEKCLEAKPLAMSELSSILCIKDNNQEFYFDNYEIIAQD